MSGLLQDAIAQMFALVPFSKKAEGAKARVADAFSERYDALLAGGKTEAEAAGLLLTDYGDLDKALALVGVAPDDILPDETDTEADVPMQLPMLQYALRCVKTGASRVAAGAA